MSKKEIQQFWTERAPYIELMKDLENSELRQAYTELDNQRCSLEPYCLQLILSIAEPGRSMLEVGCGLGYDLRLFAKHSMKVTGIDLSKQSAYITKKGFKALGIEGEVIVADAENLPFKNSSFDLVYSFGVLHHTPNTKKAIQNIHEVLK